MHITILIHMLHMPGYVLWEHSKKDRKGLVHPCESPSVELGVPFYRRATLNAEMILETR